MVLWKSKTVNMLLAKLEHYYNDGELCSVTVSVMVENLPDLIFQQLPHNLSIIICILIVLCDKHFCYKMEIKI